MISEKVNGVRLRGLHDEVHVVVRKCDEEYQLYQRAACSEHPSFDGERHEF